MALRGRSGLQGRLAILVVVATLPLLLLSVWSSVRDRRDDTLRAQSQLQLSASLVAAHEDRLIDATRDLLAAISLMPMLQVEGAPECSRYFTSLGALYPLYTNIVLTGLDGRSVCHAHTAPGEIAVGDRPYFRQVLASRDFVMGMPVVGRLTGRRAIPFAKAVTLGDAVTGVLLAGLDVERASEALGRIALPEGARVLITDRRGVVLMEYPREAARPLGRVLINERLLQAARDMSAITGEAADSLGGERIFATAATQPVGEEALLAIISMDRATVTAGATRAMLGNLGLLTSAMVLGLLAAWWFGRTSILRPARQILGAVQRLQRGQLKTRVSLRGFTDAGEFSRIASAFNLMADSLEARQRDLQAELDRGKRAYEVLEQVINSMPDALIAVSRAGEVLMHNRAAARVIALDEQPPHVSEWPQHYGLFHTDGRKLYAYTDLPLVRATQGESGRGREILIRNALVPEGRLFDCSYQPLRQGGEITGGISVLVDITERRRNEADLILLRKAVARLNDIVMITEASPLTSPGPRIVFVNEAFERLTGRSSRDVVGETATLLYAPGGDVAALARIRKALLGGKALREELTYQAGDGRNLCLEVDTVPLGNDSGAPTHLISVLRDITARKDAERAMRESDRELQMFVRMLQRTAVAAEAITSQSSVHGTLQEVADQARLVIGCHAAQVSVTTESDWEQAVTAVSLSERHAAFAPVRPLPSAAEVYALTGGRGPLRLSQEQLQEHALLRIPAGTLDCPPPVCGLLAITLADRQGETIGLLQVLDKEDGEFTEGDEYVLLELAHLASTAIENARLFQQIRGFNTSLESRIAERTAELTRQEARFRALAEQAPVIVWNIDPAGRVTYLNRAWSDLVGGRMEDWLGHKWMQRTHPEDVEQMKINWLRSKESLQPFVGTRRVLSKSGAWHTTSYRAAPVLDEHGQTAFWVGIDSDITELKMIEEALRNSNDELQAFSYTVSHDLRAPLSAIGGFAQALEQRVKSSADDRTIHFLNRIQAGVAKMEQLIEAMLALAKVVRAPLAFEPVDLGALARDSIEAQRLRDPQRQVDVQIQADLVALGDTRLLRVVMENLVGNAWKFTSRLDHAQIEVGTQGDGVFYVRDNGAGFDMAYVDKLFGAFQRLHTESEFPGTGIGLATVRRVIARHQGRVWGESIPGKGATFYFSLSASAPPAWLGGPPSGD